MATYHIELVQSFKHDDKMTFDFDTKNCYEKICSAWGFLENQYFGARHWGFKSPALGNITSFLNLEKESNTQYKVILPLKNCPVRPNIIQVQYHKLEDTSGHLAPSTVRGANKRGKEDKVENLKTKKTKK